MCRMGAFMLRGITQIRCVSKGRASNMCSFSFLLLLGFIFDRFCWFLDMLEGLPYVVHSWFKHHGFTIKACQIPPRHSGVHFWAPNTNPARPLFVFVFQHSETFQGRTVKQDQHKHVFPVCLLGLKQKDISKHR